MRIGEILYGEYIPSNSSRLINQHKFGGTWKAVVVSCRFVRRTDDDGRLPFWQRLSQIVHAHFVVWAVHVIIIPCILERKVILCM